MNDQNKKIAESFVFVSQYVIEKMFTIEIEDGRFAPIKPSVYIDMYKSVID